jgi:hypothetical protein
VPFYWNFSPAWKEALTLKGKIAIRGNISPIAGAVISSFRLRASAYIMPPYTRSAFTSCWLTGFRRIRTTARQPVGRCVTQRVSAGQQSQVGPRVRDPGSIATEGEDVMLQSWHQRHSVQIWAVLVTTWMGYTVRR